MCLIFPKDLINKHHRMMKLVVTCAILLVTFVVVEGRYCAPGDTSVGCEQCPSDRPWVGCDHDPCIMGCPLHTDAKCTPNPCGGCYDEWFLDDGRQVWCWAY